MFAKIMQNLLAIIQEDQGFVKSTKRLKNTALQPPPPHVPHSSLKT
jgi:hypothetical protein